MALEEKGEHKERKTPIRRSEHQLTKGEKFDQYFVCFPSNGATKWHEETP
jgi:hypothetical protein